MKKLLRSCLLLSSVFVYVLSKAQHANYVANGSFEEFHDCFGLIYPNISKAKSWLSLDSNNYAGLYYNKCNGSIPISGHGYQIPKTGSAYLGTTWYYFNFSKTRGYPKNRLKKNLQAGKTYCVTFYVNIANTSTHGINGFGAYFGDGSIDTIKKCTIPLSYLNPQVKNPIGNVITDTLNWVPITGTFTANGTEKYLLLGNFLSDNNTNTLLINPTNLPLVFTDLLIDDVSCIEVDAPAYAGIDKKILAGDSVYLGRERDFAIDPYCVWYQMPSMSTIDTTSGIYVKPTVTTTYVVKQNLECGSLKWDTVVVFVDYVGMNELKIKDYELKIYPNPASDFIELKIEDDELKIDNFNVSITNSLGQMVREEEITFTNNKTTINTNNLTNGVYVLTLINGNAETASKRFVINH